MAKDTRNKKMMMIISHSTDDVDRANLAIAFAASMVSDDYDLIILFMWEGALLAKKGVIESLEGRHMTKAADLWSMIQEANTPILCCAPCAKTMGVAEKDMIAGVKLITAPSAVSEMPGRQIITF
ncbi:MAG: DsrE family protein [Desulfobulbaceae bacterium]|nr:DsrE family protein [Desulfobulbaceae bacterium]